MEDARANRKLVEDLLRQQEAGKSGADDPGKQGSDQQQDEQGKTGGQRSPEDTQNGSEAQPDGAGQQKPQEGSANPADAGDTAEAASPPEGSGTDGKAQAPDGSVPGSAGKAEDGKTPTEGEARTGATEGTAREEDQAVEQWLRQVPDDPGALLRRKFAYEAARRAAGEEQ